jgi:hypothetical protein
MKLLSFISGLFPRLEKSRILSGVKQIRNDLNDNLASLLQAAAVFFAEHGFRADSVKKMDEAISRLVSRHREFHHQNFIGSLAKITDNALSQLNVIDKLISKDFTSELIIREGLTFYKAALLQHLDSLHFFAQYTSRLLSAVYNAEAEARGSKSLIRNATPADIKWLDMHKAAYFVVLESIMLDDRELESVLAKVPEAVADADSAQFISTSHGHKVLDPLGVAHANVPSWPFYKLARLIAEYQADEFKEMESTRTILEQKLLFLRNQVDGTHNPKLEQEITYNEGRLQRLKMKLEKTGEDYAQG